MAVVKLNIKAFLRVHRIINPVLEGGTSMGSGAGIEGVQWEIEKRREKESENAPRDQPHSEPGRFNLLRRHPPTN